MSVLAPGGGAPAARAALGAETLSYYCSSGSLGGSRTQYGHARECRGSHCQVTAKPPARQSIPDLPLRLSAARGRRRGFDLGPETGRIQTGAESRWVDY